ncbi:hypothetical protein TNCT_136461 [Trichonephila clavata]|uniref:Uncharacterized protein n=1 Tax=Trichonephila clavata TaxID=2740835 RepID=A0A8X6FLD9_TRICU|nr:hypothetical protein TNCT_136461 [Trichonephila clavata]
MTQGIYEAEVSSGILLEKAQKNIGDSQGNITSCRNKVGTIGTKDEEVIAEMDKGSMVADSFCSEQECCAEWGVYGSDTHTWQWIEHTWGNLATGQTLYEGSGSGSDIYRGRDPATRETRPDWTGQKEGSGSEKTGDKKNVVEEKKDCWTMDFAIC